MNFLIFFSFTGLSNRVDRDLDSEIKLSIDVTPLEIKTLSQLLDRYFFIKVQMSKFL